jgi:hypothetical protein
MSTIALRERHIDRLLSEELESSPDFAAWLVRRVFGDRTPSGDPQSCSTRIGHNRIAGETDVLVEASFQTGATVEIHIEDKLGALPQPDQALRYSEAVRAAKCSLAACALVAPRAWIGRHPQEASRYEVCVTLEEVADYFKERADRLQASTEGQMSELLKRLRWRERLLSGAMQRRAVYGALESGELTDWNQGAAEVIAAANGLRLTVSPRQRSTGRNKVSRFIRFGERLLPHRNGKTPILKLKTAEVDTPGRVSLEVPAAANDTGLRSQAVEAGFQVKETVSGTLVVSATTGRLEELTIARPVAEQTGHLEDAGGEAQKLIEWWQIHQAAASP